MLLEHTAFCLVELRSKKSKKLKRTQKPSMELISKFKSYLVIMICLHVCVNGAGQSKLKQRLNSLEKLFRTDMYLVNERLDTVIQEREMLIQKFNETMEYLENLGKTERKEIPATETIEAHESALDNDIDNLSDAVQENTKDVEELSNTLIRIKRGLLEEKMARQSDLNSVIEQLKLIEQMNQNEMKKIPEELIAHINILTNNQKNIITSVESLTSTQAKIITNQNNIITNQNNIITNQGDMIANTGNLAKTQKKSSIW